MILYIFFFFLIILLNVSYQLLDQIHKVVYHDFKSDTGDIDYCTELDFVASMKVSKNVTAIAKYSNYDAGGGAMVPAGQAADVERISVEANLVF